MSFHQELRSRRMAAGFTQQQLSERLGVRQSVVSLYEKGSSMPSLDVLIKMADTLNCSIDDLVRNGKQIPEASAI